MFFFPPQMAGCQSAGKSAIVYVVFRGECLATGVPEKERHNALLGIKKWGETKKAEVGMGVYRVPVFIRTPISSQSVPHLKTKGDCH